MSGGAGCLNHQQYYLDFFVLWCSTFYACYSLLFMTIWLSAFFPASKTGGKKITTEFLKLTINMSNVRNTFATFHEIRVACMINIVT